jgi:hypothetical protein
MAVRLDHGEDSLAEMHEINVTPFIDVMLVLLIIFMVAAPLATVDILVNLPTSTAEPQARPPTPQFLTVKLISLWRWATTRSSVRGSAPRSMAQPAVTADAFPARAGRGPARFQHRSRGPCPVEPYRDRLGLSGARRGNAGAGAAGGALLRAAARSVGQRDQIRGACAIQHPVTSEFTAHVPRIRSPIGLGSRTAVLALAAQCQVLL